MTGLIDSHCHPEADSDLTGIAALVAIDDLAFARAHDTPARRVWATVGVHPHEAAAGRDWDALCRDAADPLVVAIGEIGLDYHYEHSPRAVQREVFERQLRLAAECDLPVSIHTREAWEDTFAILERNNPPRRGVFHCFSGGPGEAARALALGWYLSFSGILTFPKAEPLRAAAAAAPADRILIETDSPFLAPVPYRGKRNQPAWVAEVARALGQLRNWSAEEAATRTAANFSRLFPRSGGGPGPAPVKC